MLHALTKFWTHLAEQLKKESGKMQGLLKDWGKVKKGIKAEKNIAIKEKKHKVVKVIFFWQFGVTVKTAAHSHT